MYTEWKIVEWPKDLLYEELELRLRPVGRTKLRFRDVLQERHACDWSAIRQLGTICWRPRAVRHSEHGRES